MITFAELTECDAPRIPATSRMERDAVLDRVVDAALDYEEAFAADPPERWPWRPFDPALQRLFDRLNAAHFGGRVPEHRCFWYDAAGLVGELEIDACSHTAGFCADHHRAGRVIGINLRFRAAAEECERTLRHEMTHALVGLEHRHGAAWRRALAEQGAGEPWVLEDVRRYELLERGVVEEIYGIVERHEGGGPYGVVNRLRAHLGAAGITREELNLVVDTIGPHTRALVLRAVSLQGG